MFSQPQLEHEWLHQLVGQWTIRQTCRMPDGNPTETDGELTCRSLGGLWVIAESNGRSADGDPWSCVMTLGFDPAKDAFVGTFIGSMMSHLWPYQGRLDASGRRLPLDSEGPRFDGEGMATYRDTIEIISPNHWRLIGELLQEDGNWFKIMDGEHRRA